MFKTRSYTSIALAVAIATAAGTPALFKLVPAHAQLPATTFPMPDTVPEGTQLSVSSSADSMTVISEALKKEFEGEFSGTAIDVKPVDADAAIQAVLSGNADLAAISRPLTPEEEAQGLVAETIHRVKIAVVVGANNAFSGNLAGDQFAGMFRGEIADWSEVGGTGSLTFVDRPDTSDTRTSLSSYPVFKVAPFESGANTTTLPEDSNAALADTLGDTGIGYMLVSELEGVSGIRVLEMHKTLPSDPRYPFSQPFSYVYKGEASPAVSAFLGYATAEPGQAAVQSVAGDGLGGLPSVSNVVQSAANSAASDVTAAAGETANALGDAANDANDAVGNALNDAADAVGAAADQTQAAAGETTGEGVGELGEAAEQTTPDAAASAVGNVAEETSQGFGPLRWLFLIPIALTGLWLWRSRSRATAGAVGAADDDLAVASTADNSVGGAEMVSQPDLPDLSKAAASGTVLASGAGAAALGMANRTKNNATNGIQGALGDDLQDKAGDAMNDLQNDLQNKVGDLTGKTGGAVANLQGKASSTMDGLQGKASGAVGDLQGKVVNLPGKAGEAINKVTDLRGRGGPRSAGAAEAAGAAAAGLGGMAAKARQQVTDGINDGVNRAQNLVSDATESIQEDVQVHLHGMETPLRQVQRKRVDATNKRPGVPRNLAIHAQDQAQNPQGKAGESKPQASDKVVNLHRESTQKMSDAADEIDEIIDIPES